MYPNPLTSCDAYKLDHRSQFPEGTTLVFSNFTPRSSRLPGIDKVVFFGLSQYVQKYLIDDWNKNFFNVPKKEAVSAYKRRVSNMGITITYEHIEELHDLGYLPIKIMALPEGTATPVGVPMLVIWNTQSQFFWLTNYLETSLSNSLWGPCTSATIAKEYRKILLDAADRSGGSKEFVDWQGHDFSCRGMWGQEAAAMSGAGHLLSFTGSDTVCAIDFLEEYYQANSDNELIAGSVAATEHATMCMGTKESEVETYRRLITEVYPSGVVSIVSDTWDYWNVWTNIIPALKEEILTREGCLVVRPDSGSPVKIICGDPTALRGSPEHKGSFELAWEIFGGTINDKGFRQLDSHINIIYGDSITLERCKSITDGLIEKGFVPSMVFGIGSFTYSYVTRDTLGFAMKATYGEVNGEPREIFKDPITDHGDKKSAKGLLAVDINSWSKEVELSQQVTWEDVMDCSFELRFEDGVHHNAPTLQEIRNRVQGR